MGRERRLRWLLHDTPYSVMCYAALRRLFMIVSAFSRYPVYTRWQTELGIGMSMYMSLLLHDALERGRRGDTSVLAACTHGVGCRERVGEEWDESDGVMDDGMVEAGRWPFLGLKTGVA